MRQLIKFSFITFAVGAFLAGPLHAMPVAGPDAPVGLDIGGFAGVITSFLTPHEQSSGETPPSGLATTVEARLNVTAGTDALSVTMARWIREGNGDGNKIAGFGENPYQFAQITWRPSDALRVDAGSIVYLPWTDRSVQWEYFSGVGPIFPGGVYNGYIENLPGIDVTYAVGGGIDVGVALFTRGAVTGTDTRFTTPQNKDDAPDALDGQVAQTIVFHLVYSADSMAIRFSQYSETITGTEDAWVNTTDTANSLTVVDFKMNLSDSMWIKLDYLNADGDAYETANTTIAGTFSLGLGDDTVWLSFVADTASGKGENDGNDQSYTHVGYKIPIDEGSDIRFEYASQDDGNSAANTINFVMFQSF